MSASNTSRESATDWQRLERMGDEEIDTTDLPEAGDDFFERAELRYAGQPMSADELVVLRTTPDIARWLREASQVEREEAVSALRAVMERHLRR